VAPVPYTPFSVFGFQFYRYLGCSQPGGPQASLKVIG
jgi:hypothetical protein